MATAVPPEPAPELAPAGRRRQSAREPAPGRPGRQIAAPGGRSSRGDRDGRGGRSRREEILDIAAHLFAERGFAGVTVDEIGAACGVSGPALYHHFAGKEAMLGEMLASVSERLLARGDEIVAGLDDPAGALAALVDAHVAFAVAHPELITVQFRDLVHATLDDQRRVRRLQRRYVERWVEAITAAVPVADVDRARATVHATLGLMNATPYARTLPAPETAALLGDLARRLLDPAELVDVVGGGD